ncbi:5-hydroxytryptamine receptor 2C-like, partial [Haliotis asinina]|uniref:5-hydroxytryptamine receptor 2C-like n=1 Tax=Haliotis asinina TaxID=109174 RepID=UPI003531ABDE
NFKMTYNINVPRIPSIGNRETRIVVNFVFTVGIVLGNLLVLFLVVNSKKLRRSSKYILVASLAFADLTDGGFFLPMWTDILIDQKINYSCLARYLSGACGYSTATVCSLSVVALNTDFTFRRAVSQYRGWLRRVTTSIFLMICWIGPCVTLGPLVAMGMRNSDPVHCFFTLDENSTFFMCLAFFIPSGAIIISSAFVIFVHVKTQQGGYTSNTDFPYDVFVTSCLTLGFYLPFAVLQMKNFNCLPNQCYMYFISTFVVNGNLVYAKSAILPWIWLCSKRFRDEVRYLFCDVSS